MFRITNSSILAFKNGPLVLNSTRRYFATTFLLSQRKLPDILTTEDTSNLPKELVSGAPRDLSTKRIVRIYKASKAATQSGKKETEGWNLDWDVLSKGNRWENDMIGYQSSADFMQGTIMKFDSKEAAIRFSKGQGWDYYVYEPKERRFRKKEYAINFLHSPTKLKHIRTK
ncbi:hypothetical protein PACTADRAFT_49133 [Pachysolen tannophilus NRRL Y-2460]|uniref:NADH dehydrogenase [ubiquinone] iron-sulfur protein 4, mitochondrial n=1 Tax=Pachysolen tannophilus NRRL Y-2460 TaxID=669874 RepID=A0A1E4U0G7_PACTA|nr:hypothetical protein PACTADRAFT_49133 [Pachysolen tannophilus NRRL Y-2460]